MQDFLKRAQEVADLHGLNLGDEKDDFGIVELEGGAMALMINTQGVDTIIVDIESGKVINPKN